MGRGTRNDTHATGGLLRARRGAGDRNNNGIPDWAEGDLIDTVLPSTPPVPAASAQPRASAPSPQGATAPPTPLTGQVISRPADPAQARSMLDAAHKTGDYAPVFKILNKHAADIRTDEPLSDLVAHLVKRAHGKHLGLYDIEAPVGDLNQRAGLGLDLAALNTQAQWSTFSSLRDEWKAHGLRNGSGHVTPAYVQTLVNEERDRILGDAIFTAMHAKGEDAYRALLGVNYTALRSRLGGRRLRPDEKLCDILDEQDWRAALSAWRANATGPDDDDLGKWVAQAAQARRP